MKEKSTEETSLKQCDRCGQLCCRYLTIKIPAPRTVSDFDGLIWQMAHENVKAYKDSKGWYMLINNKCEHLNKKGRCNIYENRPITCREYSIDNCEFESSIEEKFLKYFDNYNELDEYCRKKFKTWDTRW